MGESTPRPAALITGANGEIGQALCVAFSDAGYRVIATDIGGTVSPPWRYIPLDLSRLPHSPELQEGFLAELEPALGSSLLKVCVNNAATQILGHLGTISDGDFAHTIAVNLFAPLILGRTLLPMLEASAGNIINIGSIHANTTKPGFVSYATSKAALLGLTKALAVDLGGRVRVNIIQPAAVATEMLRAGFAVSPSSYEALETYHPIGRVGRPEEIARMAVMIASDDVGFLTGAAIDMHGGIGARLHDPD